MEYWINIFTHNTEDISCLSEDSHKSLQDAIDDADDWNDWSYHHTIHVDKDDVATIIDLASMVAEDEENAKLDRDHEDRENIILRSQQI